MSSAAVVLMMMSSMCFCAGCILFINVKMKPAVTTAITTAATTALRDGATVYLNNANMYVGSVYRPQDKVNMCDAISVTKSNKMPIVVEKRGASWALKMDCDKDGSYTSYLTDVKDDVLQKKTTTANTSWNAKCLQNSCSFQSTKTNEYLGFSGKKLAVGPTKVTWILES